MRKMDKQSKLNIELLTREIKQIDNGNKTHREVARELVKMGYHKIPEGAVVLTEEESVNAWKNGNCNAHAIYGLAYEQARKETAEKFAEQVDKWKRKAIFYYGLAKEGCSFCVGDDDEIENEITEGEK